MAHLIPAYQGDESRHVTSEYAGRHRNCIRELLNDHVSQPFLTLREAGPQARLWTLLRERLHPSTLPAMIEGDRGATHRHSRTFITSRVHLEMRVGDTKRSDIVVLRADRTPRLTCATAGPTDVIALLDPDDVEVVIEMKAAPSYLPDQRGKFAEDVQKLDPLRQ